MGKKEWINLQGGLEFPAHGKNKCQIGKYE